MTTRYRAGQCIAGVLVLCFAGCMHSVSRSDKRMWTLASALTKLSKAVESTVRYDPTTGSLTEKQLLAAATRNDPGLLTPFEGYEVRVSTPARHAIVLVCTGDGRQGLLEDAGCSAELDRHLWQEHPALPCAFTVDVLKACPEVGQ